jgi:hypothetical protein
LNIVYDCHVPEVAGHPECAYRFLRGEDAFLMWSGYFDELMRSMWAIYGWEEELGKVPLLRDWNEGRLDIQSPLQISALMVTANALRKVVAGLRQVGSSLLGSPAHGESLAAFFEQAVAEGQVVTIDQWWG